MDEQIKDINCRKLLEEIKTTKDITENTKNAAIMYCLHAMFAPTSTKVTMDEKCKKNHRKYSIKDSQDHFMVVGESVEVFMDQLKNQGRPIQPFIFIVGSIFRQKEILVYFDSILYMVHSVLRAVDVIKSFIYFS
ncbi:uncharacterized protein LOC132937271 [Metopolophium dirhodum]|uniref:uncharacterized protein LOC132937271 n=1 Tax=Metopolophium dirhodum TaxID=44670 RepID=UPI00298F51B6|nr:uncharacterized protein LOC132937271 [Metopolophium dirhodum]